MADINGYTELYAVNIGSPPTPNVTLTTSDSSATIEAAINNASYQCIAFAPGDYTNKATYWTITRSGSSGTPRWLIAGDGGSTHPAKLSSGSRVYLPPIRLHEVSYWRFLRLCCKADYYWAWHIDGDLQSARESNYNVWESCYAHSLSVTNGFVYGIYFQRVEYGGPSRHTGNTIQHCAIRGRVGGETNETSAIDLQETLNTHVVGCELWNAHKVIGGGSGAWQTPGCVIENCDIYFDTDFRTNCSGTFTTSGYCVPAEGLIAFKTGGTPSNPGILLHNRVWGGRKVDYSLTGSGGMAGACFLSADDAGNTGAQSWWRIQDNIVMDCSTAFAGWWDTNDGHRSYIGNIIYGLRDYSQGDFESCAFWLARTKPNCEVYFNTIIDCKTNDYNNGYLYQLHNTSPNQDVRGNVFIDSTGQFYLGTTTNVQIDYNVFYGTTAYTYGGSNTNLGNYAIPDWISNAAKSVGSMVKDYASGKIMRCVTAGTTGSSPPSWPALNQPVNDGTVTWQVIRGPYTFYRKLITGPEQVTIPFAIPGTGAPEANFVPTQGDSSALGSRTGIGVNDNVAPNGVFATDLLGNNR